MIQLKLYRLSYVKKFSYFTTWVYAIKRLQLWQTLSDLGGWGASLSKILFRINNNKYVMNIRSENFRTFVYSVKQLLTNIYLYGIHSCGSYISRGGLQIKNCSKKGGIFFLKSNKVVNFSFLALIFTKISKKNVWNYETVS